MAEYKVFAQDRKYSLCYGKKVVLDLLPDKISG